MAQFKTVEKPNKATARFFKEQCIGNYNGHMSLVSHNPMLASFFASHGVDDSETLAEFLHEIANQLEDEKF